MTKKSGLIKALFEFCHVSRVKLSPDGRNNVRLDGGDVLVLHAKTQAESSGSGSGSALAPALELRREKMQESGRNNVKYLRNVFPDS